MTRQFRLMRMSSGRLQTFQKSQIFRSLDRLLNNGIIVGFLFRRKGERRIRFIDMFAGIGGFRRGMELADHECVGFIEWDKFAVASYISMHLITDEQRAYLSTLPLKQRQKEILKDEYRNGEWCSGDVRTTRADELPASDCWCFGAPCQDFSIAGKRAGLSGDRSSLIREVFRLLGETSEEKRPEWLLYENVKGMLSSNRGFDFLSILIEMDRWGYDIEWQLLDSQRHGVPQHRERVYTVGHLRRCGSRKVFPLKGTDRTDCLGIMQIGSYDRPERKNPSAYRVYDPAGISPTLNTGNGGGREPMISMKINGHHPEVVIPVLTPDRMNKRQNGRRFKDSGEPSFTLTTQDIHGVAISVDIESSHPGMYVQLAEDCMAYAVWYEKEQCYIVVRKLTPKECFRLQGWTDDYFEKAAFVNSDSQLYKQAGNGVTVTVVYDIATNMSE